MGEITIRQSQRAIVQRHLYPVEYMQLNPDMPLNYQRVNLASWIFWPPHPRLQLSAITLPA